MQEVFSAVVQAELGDISSLQKQLDDAQLVATIQIANKQDVLKDIKDITKSFKELQKAANIDFHNGDLTNNLPSSRDISKLESSLDSLTSSINEIRKAFGDLGKDSTMKPLLNSINSIETALSDVKGEFKELAKTMGSLNFSFNLDLGVKKNNPINNLTQNKDYVKNIAVPELERQAKMYEQAVMDWINKHSSSKINDPKQAVEQLIGQASRYSGYLANYWETLGEAYTNMSGFSGKKALSADRQLEGFNTYFASIKEAARVFDVDLSAIESSFSQTIDDFLDESAKIKAGANNAEEASEKLKSLQSVFTGDMPNQLEGIAGQMTELIQRLEVLGQKLDEINVSVKDTATAFNALNGTFEISNVTELTTSLDRLSTGMEQLLQNCAELRINLNGQLMGATAPLQQLEEDLNRVSNIRFGYMGEEIQEMSRVLHNFGFDGTSINNVIQDLDAMRLQVQSIRTQMGRDGQIRITVTGIDQLGRTVQEVRGVVNEVIHLQDGSLQAVTSTRLLSSSVLQEFNQAEQAQERMLQLAKRMGGIEVSMVGLDPTENINEIQALEATLAELRAEYRQLETDFGQELNVNQWREIDRVFQESADNMNAVLGRSVDTANLENVRRETQNINRAFQDLIRTERQLTELDKAILKGQSSGKQEQEVQELNAQYERLTRHFMDLQDALSGNLSDEQFERLQRTVSENIDKIEILNRKIQDVRENLRQDISLKIERGDIDLSLSNLEAQLRNVDNVFETTETSVNDLRTSITELNKAHETGNLEDIISAYNKYTDALKRTEVQVKANVTSEKGLASKDDIIKLFSDMDIWLGKNTKAAKVYGEQIDKLKAQLSDFENVTQKALKGTRSAFNTIRADAQITGNTGLTWIDRFKKSFSELSSWFSAYDILMEAGQAIHSMFDNVVLIDSVMTELKKVTNETEYAYDSFLTNAGNKAKQLGTTIDGLVSSTADFARLGYGFEESQELAEVANIYAVVGDEIESVDTATESLISTMAAFGDEVTAMQVIDKFNEVGNRFAVSSGGIGEALMRSASSMSVANNTIDETIALVTAANTVVQDVSKVGNGLKTISMRIRGATTELADAGLETEGMAESTAKLQAEIKALSGVDIMLDKNNFKSTYQILDELAEKWHDLSDIAQASIVELLAGKHQGNTMSSLMENFDIAREAIKASLESEGSAMREHEKWLESLDAKLLQLQASWQSLSQTFLDSDFLKDLLDGVINVIDVVDVLLDKFGTIPTVLVGISTVLSAKNQGLVRTITDGKGAATGLGLNVFGSILSKEILHNLAKTQAMLNTFNTLSMQSAEAQSNFKKNIIDSDSSLGKYLRTVNQGDATINGYIKSVAGATAKTVAWKAATIALNSVLTIGATLLFNYAISSINSMIQAKEEARQATMELATSAQEEAATISSAYNAYKEATLAYDGTADSKNYLESVTQDLLTALGLEEDEINNLIERYGELDKAIDKVASDSLKERLTELYAGFDAVKESLVESSREDGLFAWLDIFDLFKFDAGDFRFSVNSGFEEKMGNVLSNAGYNIAYKTKGNKIEGTFDSELPLNTAEDAVVRYEQLTEMLQVLKDNASDSVNGLYTIEQLTSSDLYKQIDADRKLLEDEYKQYIAFKESINETVAQSKYIDYLDTYGSPDNYFEFEKMVVALEKTVVATNDFTGSQEDARNVLLQTLGDVDTYTVWVDAYKEGLKEIPDVTDQAVEDAIAHLKNGIRNGIDREKLDSNEMTEIFNFFDNADRNTKEFIYRIAIQDDKTALWDLQQWQKEIQNIGECGLTSSEQMQHFYDIMNDTGESGLPTLIESYQAQINDLQTALTDLSHNRFDIVMKYPELAPYINDTDALREAIEELIDKANEDIFTYLAEQANQLKDVAPLAAESLLEVRDAIAEINANLPIDLDDTISKFEMLYEAINQSVSGTGLTTDIKQQLDAMFSELESYDPSKLFERTEHGIHLNVQEFRKLNKEYQDFNTDKIENELNQLSDEYDLVTAKLENLKAAGKEDTAEYSGLLREQDLLSQKIDANLDLMAQYKALTSDYNQWTMALSTADEDSMFANISNELANMKELYKKGRVGTDDFREFVQLMTDQDMSTASTDAIKEMYLKGLPVMEKFFTNSTDGLANFLNAVRTAGETLGGEALEWAKMTEDGNWTLNFGIGDDQKIAQAIEQVHGYAVSVEQVQILLRALSAYGFDINLDSAYTSLDTFNNRIEESKQKLQELGAEPVQIQTAFSDKESGLDVIENIKAKINEISNNATISPQVKTEQIALLNAELDKAYLKIVQFNDLPSLTIDSSQVQGEFMDLYDLMNKFNSKVNEMEVLELKGLDTTAVQKDLDSIAAEISKFVSTVEGKEVLSKLGIEIDDTSIQGVKDWFLELQNQGVSIPFTVDAQGAIEEAKQLGEQFKDIVDEEDGSIVTVRVQPDTSELQDLSKEKIDLNAKVTGDENIDKIVNAVMALEDKTIILTAETKGEDKVKTLEDTVKKVEDKTVNVVAEVQGDDDVEDLVEWIEEIPEEMLVAFEISGLEDIETIKLLILEIQELEKVFEVGAEVYGTDDVIALKEAIDSLYDREVDVGADVYGEDAVWSLKASIDALQDKTVTVTTNYVTNYITNGSPSGGAISGKTGGFTTSGKSSGGARVDGTAFAEGNWGTQDSGVALMGELGRETIVREGRFFTVGDNGAEFVKYKKNDIIFNARQTEQLFKYGKIIHGKTRGRAIVNGTAFAEGTAFSSGSGSLSNGGNTIIFGSGGSSGLGGNKGSSSSKSSSSKDDFEETFDWIEVAIDRIERAIARLDLKASSIFQSWTTRNTTLKQQINEINKEIDLQYQGYYRYIQEANSVGLSESWAKKVRDGVIDINTIKDEGLAEQIQKYQEW